MMPVTTREDRYRYRAVPASGAQYTTMDEILFVESLSEKVRIRYLEHVRTRRYDAGVDREKVLQALGGQA